MNDLLKKKEINKLVYRIRDKSYLIEITLSLFDKYLLYI